MATHVPQKVPEHFSRVDIGAYMRELRLHYGLSEQDVSQRLHIRIKYVTAIETANFDAMPGKAYARGYVHTYAEFLGLDADQVVERCFGGEMAREVQSHSIPDSSNWYKRNKAYGGVLAVLLLLGGLFYVAQQGDAAPDAETAQLTEGVESVPEEYLRSMRTRLMPTASNYACLSDASLLGCYRSQRLTRQWTVPRVAPDMSPAPASAFADSPVEKAVEEAEEKTEAKEPAKPAEKPVEKKTETKKPATKKPEPSKAAEKLTPEERAKLGDDYPGYYIPPKPKAKAEPTLPTELPKADAEAKPEPKADE